MQICEFPAGEFEGVIRQFFIPTISRGGCNVPVRAALQTLGEGLALSRSRWGPRSSIRTDKMAANSSEDNRMLFTVQVAGQGQMLQRGRFAETAAGAGILIEARSPFERVTPTESQYLTLSFSRELLPLRVAEITEACARTLDPAAPAMQVLGAYLGRLFGIADRLTAPQRLDAGQ
ncbi:hypothetical protein, partial [Pseudonocardia xinjiangensis]|uniref:AraC-like ligand-binding domain-containing protein n=1 Tax=Pseudonocardia xinjiangensis TaxID=75289 RepID=UPI0031D110F2